VGREGGIRGYRRRQRNRPLSIDWEPGILNVVPARDRKEMGSQGLSVKGRL
jgi:hypothetical protein